MPNLTQGLLTRGALDKAAGAILGNWKNGIGATAGLPSSSKSIRSDDAAVCSHGGSSSASSRDSELRFRWGDDVLLLEFILSLPVSLAADIEEEEDWAVSFATGHPSCGNCIAVNSLSARSDGPGGGLVRARSFVPATCYRVDSYRVDSWTGRGASAAPRLSVLTYSGEP